VMSLGRARCWALTPISSAAYKTTLAMMQNAQRIVCYLSDHKYS
jgi:hypothetical protein